MRAADANESDPADRLRRINAELEDYNWMLQRMIQENRPQKGINEMLAKGALLRAEALKAMEELRKQH